MKKTLENLQLAYDGLMELSQTNPEIKRDFDMKIFGVFRTKTCEQIKNNECDTCGCLLGNIARVLPIDDTDFEEINGLTFSYHKFKNRNFHGFNNKDFSFLFASYWDNTFPTFEDAMNRLKYFINCQGKIGEYGIDWNFTEGIINNKLHKINYYEI